MHSWEMHTQGIDVQHRRPMTKGPYGFLQAGRTGRVTKMALVVAGKKAASVMSVADTREVPAAASLPRLLQHPLAEDKRCSPRQGMMHIHHTELSSSISSGLVTTHAFSHIFCLYHDD